MMTHALAQSQEEFVEGDDGPLVADPQHRRCDEVQRLRERRGRHTGVVLPQRLYEILRFPVQSVVTFHM